MFEKLITYFSLTVISKNLKAHNILKYKKIINFKLNFHDFV